MGPWRPAERSDRYWLQRFRCSLTTWQRLKKTWLSSGHSRRDVIDLQLRASAETQGCIRELRPPVSRPRYLWLRGVQNRWPDAVVSYSIEPRSNGDFEVLLYLIARDIRVQHQGIGDDALRFVLDSVEDEVFRCGPVRRVLFRASVRDGNRGSERMFTRNSWRCLGPMNRQPEYNEWVLQAAYDD